MKLSLHASKAKFVIEIICRDSIFLFPCEYVITYKQPSERSEVKQN